MRRGLIALVLSALVAAGAEARSSAGRPGSIRACSGMTVEGEISGSYGTVARRPCAVSLAVDSTLYSHDRVSTPAGTLQFVTRHINRCRMLVGASDLLYPRPGVALEHRWGRTLCFDAQHRVVRLRAVGAKIEALPARTRGATVERDNPLFVLLSTRRATVLKVETGTCIVSSPLRGGRTIVRAGKKVTVRVGMPPGKPSAIRLSSLEQAAVRALRADVPPMDLDQARRLFERLEQRSGLLVASNERTLAKVTRALPEVEFLAITRNQFSGANMQRQIRGLRPRITLLAGSETEMAAAMPRLRKLLASDAVIVLIPI